MSKVMIWGVIIPVLLLLISSVNALPPAHGGYIAENNTCYSENNNFEILTYNCKAQDLDSKQITQYVNFKWNGVSPLDTDWIFAYSGALKSGKIYYWTEIEYQESIIGNVTMNGTFSNIVDFVNLGTPTEGICDYGNEWNTHAYNATRTINGTNISEVFCFTNFGMINPTTYWLEGNYSSLTSKTSTKMGWKDVTNLINYEGNNLLGYGMYYYTVSSKTFQPDELVKTKWVYTPADSDTTGKWHIFGKRQSDTLSEAIGSGNYIYQDPYWYDNWSVEVPINLSVASGSLNKNYTMIFNITYKDGMQTDFDDLRFSDETKNETPYWIKDKVDSQWAEVWVRVPNNITTANQTLLYMFYDNDGVNTTSNQTPYFGDDFTTDRFYDVGTGIGVNTTGGYMHINPSTGAAVWVGSSTINNTNQGWIDPQGNWSFEIYWTFFGSIANNGQQGNFGFLDGFVQNGSLNNPKDGLFIQNYNQYFRIVYYKNGKFHRFVNYQAGQPITRIINLTKVGTTITAYEMDGSRNVLGFGSNSTADENWNPTFFGGYTIRNTGALNVDIYDYTARQYAETAPVYSFDYPTAQPYINMDSIQDLPANIDPIENTTTTVNASANATSDTFDAGVCYLYYPNSTLKTSFLADETVINATITQLDCQFTMNYFEIGGSYNVTIVGNTTGSLTNQTSDTFTYNNLNSFYLNTTSINYGTIAIGANSTHIFNMINSGNVNLSSNISSTNLIGSIGTIHVSNMTYDDDSDLSDGTTMQSTPQPLTTTLILAIKTIYLNIAIPLPSLPDTYTANVTIVT